MNYKSALLAPWRLLVFISRAVAFVLMFCVSPSFRRELAMLFDYTSTNDI